MMIEKNQNIFQYLDCEISRYLLRENYVILLQIKIISIKESQNSRVTRSRTTGQYERQKFLLTKMIIINYKPKGYVPCFARSLRLVVNDVAKINNEIVSLFNVHREFIKNI